MLIFNDTQMRKITSDILLTTTPPTPSYLNLYTIALNNITAVQGQKAAALIVDDANSIFYDNYKDIISSYSDERKYIDGSYYTAYSNSDLLDAAQQVNNCAHFPTSPIWVNLQPKVLSSNNGSPLLSFGTIESGSYNAFLSADNVLKSGFNSPFGNQTTASTGAITGGPVYLVPVTGGTGTSFTTGDIIFIYLSNVSLLGIITGTTANDISFTLLVTPTSMATLSTGSTVKNFSSGFSNSDREGTTTSYAPEVMAYYKSFIDPHAVSWKTSLNNQLAALNSNSATGTDNTNNQTAITNINNAITDINTWQAAPNTGVGTGRYGNTLLATLESLRTSRITQNSTRVTQITTALGSVSQLPDGTYSGTGYFYNLFYWIDIRVNRTGTLTQYYGYDLTILALQQKYDLLVGQMSIYNTYFLVSALYSSAQQSQVVTAPDVSGSLNDKYFFISTTDSDYYVWFNVNDEGTNPNRATGVYSNINFIAQSPGIIGNSISITFDGLTSIGQIVDAWNLANVSNQVVYYGNILISDIPPAGSITLTGAFDRQSVQVNLITNETANNIAILIADAINSASTSGNFSSPVPVGNTVIIDNSVKGYTLNVTGDVDSGFTISTLVTGYSPIKTGLNIVLGVFDSTGFSVSDSVSILDDTLITTTAAVVSVVGELVTLNIGSIPNYTIPNNARLVKQLN